MPVLSFSKLSKLERYFIERYRSEPVFRAAVLAFKAGDKQPLFNLLNKAGVHHG